MITTAVYHTFPDRIFIELDLSVSTTMCADAADSHEARSAVRAQSTVESLPAELVFAFQPLDRRAFGIAVGVAAALSIFLLTIAGILLDPEGRTRLILLAQYFYGYEVSWTGAVIGALWAFGVGFVAGWFVAFVRNFTLAAWIFLTHTRAELSATRDFLDHI